MFRGRGEREEEQEGEALPQWVFGLPWRSASLEGLRHRGAFW